MQNSLRRALIVGLCLVPFIPFVVANFWFFPFITGKNFAFRILVEILAALWAYLAISDPAMRPKLPWQKGWKLLPNLLLLFVISLAVSAALAVNPVKAFWSNFERMEGWIGIAHLALYFFVLWLTMNSEKLWSRFWNTSIAVSLGMGLFGLMQLAGVFTINQGGVRVDGTFGNAGYLAVYMLFHFFVTFYYLVKNWSKSVWLKVFYLAAMALQLTMIFFSATRGSILGLLGGLLVFGASLILFGKGAASARKWGIWAAVAVLVIVGGFVALKDTPFVKGNDVLTRFSDITSSEATTRLTIWNMALQGFAERPVFGWGQEGFNYVFNKYYQPSLYGQEPWFDRAHNAFLDWLIAGGLPAFLLYVSFFLVGVWYIWRKESTFTVFEKSLFTGLLAAYAGNNLFVFDNLLSYVFFVTTLAYVMFKSAPEAPALPEPAPASQNTRTLLGSAILIVALAAMYFANVPGMAVASDLIQALTPQCANTAGVHVSCSAVGSARDININFDYMQKANTAKGLGEQEAHEQLLQFGAQVTSQNAGDAAFINKVDGFAVTAMQDELKQVPNDARLQLFYGSFLRQVGQNDLSLPVLTRAHELSPKKQQIIFELAILENNQGHYAAALDWFKQAYELDTSYDDARSFYAATAIRAGKTDVAYALLNERYGTVTPDNDYILQAYIDVKDFAKAITIQKARIDARPKDAQLHIRLAAIYLAAGQRQTSIQELEAASALDLSLKQQNDYYIQQIQAGNNP